MALEAVRLSRTLRSERNFELASQFIRSGTAPGALVAEYFYAESDRDRVHKLKIALKEANENKYWTSICRDSYHLNKNDANEHLKKLTSLIRVLNLFVAKHD